MSCELNGERNILFSFGLITDIQYADIGDGQNYSKTKWRRYRNALFCLQEAVAHWKGAKCSPEFIVQLGDLIDGFNSSLVDENDSERNFSKEAFDAVVNEFSKLPREIPVLHNIGNHELYNFSREELERSILHPSNSCQNAAFLNMHQSHPTASKEETKPFYFSFTPHPKFCFVYLDSYDISILGADESSPWYKQAVGMLRKYNKNEDLHSPNGLYGLERRFVKFNGAISRAQLSWLQTTLKKAEECGQKTVIFSHVPIFPENVDPMTVLWNYQDVLEVLWRFSCVVACFHGHTHEWGYAVDKNGIHHCVFDGVIEAPLDSNAFATLHVKDDSIVIEGFGVVESRVLKFSH
ncbi:hypothetical protein OS493_014036 [Desmophyllum pertusum]|uniref:Calcineurin-like phosphoesterase domain-containing protein n=1 Tax=Desmophyllum pertusum TaxID=174260 RepID=A0A9W9ZDY1_9CNID|nr:hypothetical protein OS493_014036 [Desmophyllum pertusum]